MINMRFLINNLSRGGAERTVSRISLKMNNNIKKELLLFGKDAEVGYSYKGNLVYLDREDDSGKTKKLLNFINRTKKLKEMKQKNDTPTISFLLYANLINALTARSGRTILSVRNHMTTQFKTGNMSKFWNFVIKYIYPKADLITVVSREIKEDLIKNYKIEKSKIKVIYNSYDIQNIQELSQEPLDKEYEEIFQKSVIVTVGRLNKQKGIQHLIRAFSNAYKNKSELRLVIIGSGTQENYLKQLVTNLDLNNVVHFLGHQDNPFKFISKSQLYVMPSIFEGFPNSLSEAMACGAPVLASDCLSGPREILAPQEFGKEEINYEISKKRFGVLMPVCNGEEYSSEDLLIKEELKMADLIIKLFENDEMREYFSNKSLERIENFNINKIIKEWENIL